MVTCIAIDYSSLSTCYHGNIAMQMAVDYIALSAYSHAQVHMHNYVRAHTCTNTSMCRPLFHPLRTLDPRYIPCIGYVIYDLLITVYDKEL